VVPSVGKILRQAWDITLKCYILLFTAKPDTPLLVVIFLKTLPLL